MFILPVAIEDVGRLTQVVVNSKYGKWYVLGVSLRHNELSKINLYAPTSGTIKQARLGRGEYWSTIFYSNVAETRGTGMEFWVEIADGNGKSLLSVPMGAGEHKIIGSPIAELVDEQEIISIYEVKGKGKYQVVLLLSPPDGNLLKEAQIGGKLEKLLRDKDTGKIITVPKAQGAT